MKVSEFYKNTSTPIISFEIFPPKKELGIESMYPVLSSLAEVNPSFISVTCGAGGGEGKTNKTIELASRIKQVYDIESVAHIKCIGQSKSSIASQLDDISDNKIENVLALRGDIPKGGLSSGGDFTYAKDLIKQIKNTQNLCIAAAAYPEGHIDCEDYNKSIEHLKQKEDAGAALFITQLFFDNAYYYNLMDKALSAGIKSPIVPGIMPMLGKSQIEKMIFMCGVSLPSAMIKLINKYADDPASLIDAGLQYSASQIADLKQNNACGIHIYTMNKPFIAKTLA